MRRRLNVGKTCIVLLMVLSGAAWSVQGTEHKDFENVVLPTTGIPSGPR